MANLTAIWGYMERTQISYPGLAPSRFTAPVDPGQAYAELQWDLGKEKKKHRSRDCILVMMWKAMWIIFVCTFPYIDFLKNVDNFSFLSSVDEDGSDAESLGDNATS